jgi:hypothetical protein
MEDSRRKLTWAKALATVAVCGTTVMIHNSRRDPFGDPFAFIALAIICGILQLGPAVTGCGVFLGTFLYAAMRADNPPERPASDGIAMAYVMFFSFSFAVIASVSYFGGAWIRRRVDSYLDEGL